MHLTQIHNPQHTYTNKLMIMQDDDGHVVEYIVIAKNHIDETTVKAG